MMEILNNLNHILKWQSEGKRTALATVVRKQGSALRTVGAKMAISSAMEMAGSISGGCVEGAVVQEALKVMESGRPVVLKYGIADETAWSVGLACGGTIQALVQKVGEASSRCLAPSLIQAMMDKLEKRQMFSLLIEMGEADLGRTWILDENGEVFAGEKSAVVHPALIEQVRRLEATETSQMITLDGKEIFVDVFAPNPRLILIGAVHIAQALAQMARITGFYTVMIDPRKAFNTAERFPDVDQRVLKWPDEALLEFGLGQQDYLLLLSHDDKLDLPALKIGLDRQVKYIGMLASRLARDKRFEIMQADGYSPDLLAAIHSPVGLNIGARSQEEIALSILSQITAFRYGKNPG